MRFLIFPIFSNTYKVFLYINKIKLLFDNIFLITYYNVIVILSSLSIYSFPLLLSSSSDGNSDNDPEDDPQDVEVVELEDYNGPEQVMNDLDLVDEARMGYLDALNEVKKNYPEFFNENDDEEGLRQVEEYLENEFPKELAQSEREADELEAIARAYNNGGGSNRPGPSGSSGPSGPSAPSGPSDPSGPSESGGSNFSSKILILLGGIFETISEFINNLF